MQNKCTHAVKYKMINKQIFVLFGCFRPGITMIIIKKRQMKHVTEMSQKSDQKTVELVSNVMDQ